MARPSLNLFGRLWLYAQRLNVLSSKDVKVICGPCTRQTFLSVSACIRQHIMVRHFTKLCKPVYPWKIASDLTYQGKDSTSNRHYLCLYPRYHCHRSCTATLKIWCNALRHTVQLARSLSGKEARGVQGAWWLTIPGRDGCTEDEEECVRCLAVPPDHCSQGCKPAQHHMNPHVDHWLQHTHTSCLISASV